MKTNTIKLMQNHRSIRKYLNKPIDDDILDELLTAAQSASSSHNVQSYSIIIIKDKNKKEKLSELCGSQEWVKECPVFLVFCADLFRLKVACEMEGREAALNGVENLIVGVVDTSLAAQNLMLGAESYGLGGVFIGGIRNDSAEVSKILNLPEYVIPVFGVCLGYPAQEPWKKPRLPQYVVVHDNEYKTENIKKGLEEYDKTTKDYYIRRTNGEKDKGWVTLMSEYINTERRLDLKEYIISQGIKLT